MRVIDQFRKSYRRNDKPSLLAATRFIAHLLNQQVAGEVLGLQVLELLLTNPTDDSVEVAVMFTKEFGAMLQEISPAGFRYVFGRFRGILHEGVIDKRVQYLIEGLFAQSKLNFSEHPSILPELDLVEEEDQITHEVGLDDEIDVQEKLNYFQYDENYLENEAKYASVKKELLGEGSSGEEDGSDSSDSDSDEDEEEEEKGLFSFHSLRFYFLKNLSLILLSTCSEQQEVAIWRLRIGQVQTPSSFASPSTSPSCRVSILKIARTSYYS